jgi:hypothetical protein
MTELEQMFTLIVSFHNSLNYLASAIREEKEIIGTQMKGE